MGGDVYNPSKIQYSARGRLFNKRKFKFREGTFSHSRNFKFREGTFIKSEFQILRGDVYK